jgi:hypothetical protein
VTGTVHIFVASMILKIDEGLKRLDERFVKDWHPWALSRMKNIYDTSGIGDVIVREEKRTAIILFIVASLFFGGLLGLGALHVQMTEAQKAYIHQQAPNRT